MSIYISWETTEHKFVKWQYVGNGVTEPVFEETTVEHRALWSNDVSPDLIERAKNFIETDRPGAALVVESQIR